MEGALPVNIRPHRHPPTQKDAIESMVKELLEAGVIKKKSKSRYHKIRMDEKDVAKTAFRTHEDHYEFLVMPFGLTNAPSTFQSLLNEKWRGYLLDRHFKIKTDHLSLKYLLDPRMTTPAQLKWLPKLMGFDYEILFKKGVDNVTDDALSMMQNPVELLSIVCASAIFTDLYQQVSDGQTKVVNRSLEFYLRCMAGEQPKQWWKAPSVHIPYIGGESKVEMVDKTLSEREAAVEILKFHIKRAQDRMKS
ncbi:retrotransposable element Tf2 [Tanacetum coccineum]